MEMIEKYVKLVGQNLPAATSEDIQKEIRSLIEDTLEDKSRSTGRPVDEEMVVEVLKSLGRPEKVAASYLPPRYLIGPDLFPNFIATLKIVLSVTTVLAMLALGMSLVVKAGQEATIGQTLLEVFGGLVDMIFRATAIVVFVFAVLQWAGKELNTKEKPWDPRTMKVDADPQKIKAAELITDLVLTIIVLVVLNFYPQWVGIWSFKDGSWLHAPVLTEAFFHYLPWLSVVFGLDIIRNIALLASGRWTAATRWYSLVVSLATILMAAWMLSGPALAAIDPASFNQLGWGALNAETLALANKGVNLSMRLVIAIVLVVEVVEMGRNLYWMVLKDQMPVLKSKLD